MLGTLLSVVGFDLKRTIRNATVTVVLALAGAALIVLALAFGIAALYYWLELRYGTLPALGILGAGSAVLGAILLSVAFLRPSGRRRPPAPAANPVSDPVAAMTQATEEAVESATGLVREGSRKQVFGTVLVAALVGFLLGRRV